MIHTVKNFGKAAFVSCLLFGLLSKTSAQVSTVPTDVNFKTVPNKNGPTLGVAKTSGIKILTVNGLRFKDLNKNGALDKYEDWRLPVDERAKDLASKMTVEQIAGLMLYSAHQAVPAAPRALVPLPTTVSLLLKAACRPTSLQISKRNF